MSNVNKILVGLLLILLVVTTGEIGYYFLFQSPNKQLSFINTKIKTNLAQKSATNNNKNSSIEKTASQEAQKKKDPILGRQVASLLNDLKSDLMSSSKVTNTYEGKITNLDLKGGMHPSKKFEYVAKVSIYKYSVKSQKVIFFRKEEMGKLKIYDLISGKERSIQLKDLEEGDVVRIIQTLDLKDSYSKPVTTIIKIAVKSLRQK